MEREYGNFLYEFQTGSEERRTESINKRILGRFVNKRERFRKNVIKKWKNCVQIVFIYQNVLEFSGNP